MPHFGPRTSIPWPQLAASTGPLSAPATLPALPTNLTLSVSRTSPIIANDPNGLDIPLLPLPLSYSTLPSTPFDSSLETHEPSSIHPEVPPVVLGGCLALFACSWGKITTDGWVLDIIRRAYLIEFLSFPPRHLPRGGPWGSIPP